MTGITMDRTSSSKLLVAAIAALSAFLGLHAKAARPEDLPKPADAPLSATETFGVVSAAKSAVADQQLHAQSPTRVGDDYQVVVTVNGSICTVKISPKVPVVQRPILQWTAGKPVCTR